MTVPGDAARRHRVCRRRSISCRSRGGRPSLPRDDRRGSARSARFRKPAAIGSDAAGTTLSVVVARARRPRLHAALPRERPAQRRRRRSRARSWSTTPRPTGRASTSRRSPSATRGFVCCGTTRTAASRPAVNQGLRAATGDVLVVLNNDTIVPPGWLSRLVGPSRTLRDRPRRADDEPLRQRGRGRRSLPHLW